jgi:hypothetical protein
MRDFSLCNYTTINTSEPSISLQEAIHLVTEIFDKIPALERRLRLREMQLESNNMTYFPTLATERTTGNKKLNCFQDVCNYDATIGLFSMAFDVNAETVPAGSEKFI